ncbi:class I glutamine amidotransferase-like protein [Coprinopsis sp. MPI-PUGE-AT-0042]|nr:class I glutamine amidotransferase-like protein [Coprinopsis sp. MPI-PUGE-AT-0042]
MASTTSSKNPSINGGLFPPQSKICFLLCDPTRAEFVDVYGDFTNLLTSMYTKILGNFAGRGASSFLPGSMPHIFPFKAFEGSLPYLETIDQYDSIIVSGSRFGVNDSDTQPWILELGTLLHTVATQHPTVKMIVYARMCFGHQIIAHTVFGQTVQQNPEWEIGPYPVDLNDVGKKIFPGRDHLNLEMFHHDAVFQSEIGPSEGEFLVWGSSQMTANQGIVAVNKNAPKDTFNVDDIHIFTCQGHPEMTSGMISRLVDIFEVDLGSDACKEGREQIANFKGTLDWLPLGLLMWRMSTKHSVVVPPLYESAEGYLDLVQELKKARTAGASLNRPENLVVCVS